MALCRNKLLAGLATLALLNCAKVPLFNRAPSKSSIRYAARESVPTKLDPASGQESAKISAVAKSTQELVASSGPITGAAVAFPPRALAADSTVALAEAATVASPSNLTRLGLSDEFISSASPVSIQSETKQNALIPFTVTIPMPPTSVALDANGLNLSVVYLTTDSDAAAGQATLGAFERSKLTVSGDKVQFQTRNFGNFQAIWAKKPTDQVNYVLLTTAVLTKVQAALLPSLRITGRSALVVGTGNGFELVGTNFRPTLTLALADTPVNKLLVASDTKASFVIPNALNFGLTTLTAEQDGTKAAVPLFFTGSKTDLPITTKPAAEICAGERYYDANGDIQTGTRICAGADLSALTAGRLAVGTTVAGVIGTVVPSPADCTSDAQTGCVTTNIYPAANVTGLASKVLGGTTVAGVAGAITLPLASKVLTGTSFGIDSLSSGTLTLPDPNRVATSNGDYGTGGTGSTPKLTLPLAENVRAVNGTFGIGGNATSPGLNDCAGDYQLGCVTVPGYPSANTNQFTAADIAPTVTIAGVAGQRVSCSSDGDPGCYTTSEFPSAAVTATTGQNIRTGVTLAGVSGALATNCRNGISSVYNFDGTSTGLPNTAVSTGADYDVWDTVDDSNGFTAFAVTNWADSTRCGSSTWSDATTLDGGGTLAAGGCGSSSTCIYKDSITNLLVTGILSSGGTTSNGTPQSFAWNSAMTTCDSSTYGGYSAGNWRLPTQKELMALYAHGLVSRNSASFGTLTNLRSQFWSATSSASITAYAWTTNLASGYTTTNVKTSTLYVMCVH